MTGTLAKYLRDFSTPGADLVVSPATAGIESAVPVHEVVDLDAERAAAYARGVEAAAGEWSSRLEAERAELIAAHQAELAALREKNDIATASHLASRLEEIATAVADAVADSAAEVLAPVMDAALAAKAVSDMAAMLRETLLQDGAVTVLTIRGPHSLYEKLKQALDAPEALLRHVEADDVDISVDFGDAALITRLSAWSASLRKVMA